MTTVPTTTTLTDTEAPRWPRWKLAREIFWWLANTIGGAIAAAVLLALALHYWLGVSVTDATHRPGVWLTVVTAVALAGITVKACYDGVRNAVRAHRTTMYAWMRLWDEQVVSWITKPVSGYQLTATDIEGMKPRELAGTLALQWVRDWADPERVMPEADYIRDVIDNGQVVVLTHTGAQTPYWMRDLLTDTVGRAVLVPNHRTGQTMMLCGEHDEILRRVVEDDSVAKLVELTLIHRHVKPSSWLARDIPTAAEAASGEPTTAEPTAAESDNDDVNPFINEESG
jgi:hypothetical protein